MVIVYFRISSIEFIIHIYDIKQVIWSASRDVSFEGLQDLLEESIDVVEHCDGYLPILGIVDGHPKVIILGTTTDI